jgi:ubiquinone/menaquinone biosynthesis C-methylase UbiE
MNNQKVGRNIKVINEYQKQMYEEYEKATANGLIKQYSHILNKIKNCNISNIGWGGGGYYNRIKILDIGGASGNFALELCGYFSENECEVTVVDTTRYDTWNNYTKKITFVENSANNLEKLFSENTFDIIFANRVFHHFVRETWKETINGINDIMRQIAFVLKEDGYFCITDYFYDGRIFDKSSSKIIYALTSYKIPFLVNIFKRMKSKSAGIGVCFLSRKMWYDLFSRNGFIIEELNEGHKLQWKKFQMFVYKICLLIKNAQEDIIMIVKLSSFSNDKKSYNL